MVDRSESRSSLSSLHRNCLHHADSLDAYKVPMQVVRMISQLCAGMQDSVQMRPLFLDEMERRDLRSGRGKGIDQHQHLPAVAPSSLPTFSYRCS